MKIKVVIVAALAALVLSGCTTGVKSSDDNSDSGSTAASAKQGSGGVPEVVQPIAVRDLVHSDMKGKRVAFIPILYKGFKITEEWGQQMQRSFDNLGAEFKVYDSNFDTDQMVRTINDLVQGRKVDVLVLHNPDLNVLSQQITDAQKAGIYVIVLNMISNQSGDVFIGADLVSAAQDITRRAAEDCKAAGKKQIALVNGPATDPWNVLYATGVKKVAKETGLEIVDITDSKWQADLANQQAATLVQRHGKDLCALMVPWDVVAIPAAQAVKSAVAQGQIPEDSIGVYALDSSSDGCDAIRSGAIRATVAYDQDAIGAGAAMAAQQLVQLKNPPGSQRVVTYVPHVLVDKSNVDKVTFACYSGMS